MPVSSHVKNVLGLTYDELPALLTVQQFAQLVQLREVRVLELLREGTIPGIRLGRGGNWRIPKSVVAKWVVQA